MSIIQAAPMPVPAAETAVQVVWPPASVVGGSAPWHGHAGQPELFPAVLGDLGVGTDLDDWLERFTLTMLEVLSARRPARQLDLVLTIPVRLNVKRSIRAAARPELVSVRGQRTGRGTIEASAHLRVGWRSVAAAFRLSRTTGRWVCNAWQLRPEDLMPATVAG